MRPINRTLIKMAGTESMMHPFTLLMYEITAVMGSNCGHLPKGIQVAEMGVDVGHSTVALLSGIARCGKGHLWSCDINDHSKSPDILESGLTDFWTFKQMDSFSFAAEFSDEFFALVFIDTSHEREQTVKELAAWSPKVSHGGRILLHDTQSRVEGVGQPVVEFALAHPDWTYYNIDVGCGLGVLQKR